MAINSYPFNLMRTIVQEKENMSDETYKLHPKGLFNTLCQLDTDAYAYIKYKYKDHYSRKAIAQKLNITMNDLHALEYRTMNFLRRPDTRLKIQGISKEESEQLQHENRSLRQENERLRQLIKRQDAHPYDDSRFDRLEDTSLHINTVRKLKRADYHTVNDLLMTTLDQIESKPRIGQSTVEEVKWFLDQYKKEHTS